MAAPAIALAGVTHHYGTKPALDLDDLVIAPGSTAVLGPNGSGKSTLIRLLATVSALQAGSLRVDGLDPNVVVERTRIRRRLGYQTQAGALPPNMRVDAFCDYVGALKEIAEARHRRRWTHWVLNRVGLGDVARDRIRTLSGGMQRRVALAQALIGLPDLLLLDEPMTSLDAEQRANVAGIIGERAADATVVVTTHHPDDVAAVCARVIVLSRGRIVFTGTPADLAEQARGFVWETVTVPAGVTSRSVGAGRHRCVSPRPPVGADLVDPTVQDGYTVAVARAGQDNGA